MRTFILLVAVIAAIIGTASAVMSGAVLGSVEIDASHMTVVKEGTATQAIEDNHLVERAVIVDMHYYPNHIDYSDPIANVEHYYNSGGYNGTVAKLSKIAKKIYIQSNETGYPVNPVFVAEANGHTVLAASDGLEGMVLAEVLNDEYLPLYLRLFGVEDQKVISKAPLQSELDDGRRPATPEAIADAKAYHLNYTLETGSAYIATEGLHLNHDTIYYGPKPEYETGYQEYGFENTTVIGEVHVYQTGSSPLTHSDMYNDVLVANNSVYVQVSKEPTNMGYYTIDYMQDENTRAEITVLPQYLEYVLSQYVTGSDVDSHFLG